MHKVYGILGICLIALSFACKKSSNLKGDLSNFKIEDTAAITKIFLADKNGNTVLLERGKDNWTVNGKYPARKDYLQVLLETLRRIEMKSNVGKNSVETILKSLATSHHKVEVYLNGESKPYKVLYVGGSTQDQLGTYMLIEGSTMPYITYVPGERAFLTPRFKPYENEWRDKALFNFQSPEEIKKIRIESFEHPETSFELEVIDRMNFKLRSLKDNQELQGYDTARVKTYLRRFKSLGFVRYTEATPEHLDSLKQKYRYYNITVTTSNNEIRSVQLFRNPVPIGTLDINGRPVVFDMDEMFGIIQDGSTVVAQYFTYDPIALPVSWFFEKGIPEDPWL